MLLLALLASVPAAERALPDQLQDDAAIQAWQGAVRPKI
jgi:hypothetical protein